MKNILKRIFIVGCSLLYYAVHCIYLLFRYLVKSDRPGSCIVFYYHGIASDLQIRFSKQLNIIKKFSIPIPADHSHPLQSGKRYSIITFDDGLISVLHNAVPELIERKMPATIFVPSGYIGRSAEWMVSKEGMDGNESVMNADQLAALDQGLISIGSHCISHTSLSLLDRAEAIKEITQSAQTLERIVNRKITLLSFPHGEYCPMHISIAKTAGYTRVFTITPQRALSIPDEYITGRILADPRDWLIEITLKMFGAYSWLPLAFRVKRLLKRVLGNSR